MFAIEYEPRIEDPVIIKTFATLEEAQEHLDMIRVQRPKAAPFHRIVKVLNESDVIKDHLQRVHWEEVSR